MISTPPLSLYLHFPWCVKKCPYCDFNSHTSSKPVDQWGYVDALVRDLDFELSDQTTSPVLHSVFMGGGTPSLFAPEMMATVLEAAKQRLGFSGNCEITMEANPGTTEHHDFGQYRDAGINRLSLGVQSFDNGRLKTLGRIHNAENARQAFYKARENGFDNINIDLMFGLPGQTREDALQDINQAIELGPEHISLYQLTLEPNTVFFRYPPKLPDPDHIMEMQHALQGVLATAGYEQYEISAYARPGRQSVHNLGYWQFADYIGIGAGAHGKRSGPTGIVRRARKKHPATYQKLSGTGQAIAEVRDVAGNELLFEFLMNALRLKAGFSLGLATHRTGCDADTIQRSLQPGMDKALLRNDSGIIKCSEQGYLFLDDILSDLAGLTG